ncbi:MAG: alanine--tRNA ligase, partial [Chloroflexi bacterium]|nr:alanine--tRNA ligase [Chloroflexota bacterium]
FGRELGCGASDCGPSCGCGRFSEIWNLVFTQYNQDTQGTRTPLPRPNIDTGMGLERVAAVMQGKTTVYETDLFIPLIAAVGRMTGKEYGRDEATSRAMRIVSEHGRAVAFLIADGVLPSNEGRGYVLRRELRRALLFGRKLGLTEPFLAQLADGVVRKMGGVYPELETNRDLVCNVVNQEEERFRQALGTGLNWLDRVMEKAEATGDKMVRGEDVFMLYDTYGFPQELTAEVAAERGFSVDMNGFEQEMEQQRKRARASQRFGLGDTSSLQLYERMGIAATDFVGYQHLKHETVVVGLVSGGQPVDSASAGSDVQVVLQGTPFYAEMGGQVGDTGEIRGRNGRLTVSQTTRPLAEIVAHQGRVTEGWIAVGDRIEAAVDAGRRSDIARNHTATHVLQSALRIVLGNHVRQAGSRVAPDRFRFDFTHHESLTREQLLEVERIANEKVRENLPVMTTSISYDDAVARGAMALFGEKYGDVVRMVEVGDPPFSVELCGGTHVSATGEIGLLHIASEGSVGSGVRRVEALTGRGAERFVEERLSTLDAVARELQTTPEAVEDRLSALLSDLDKERKRATALERQMAEKMTASLLSQVVPVGGVNVLSARVSVTSTEALREMGDQLKEQLGSGIVVLGAVLDNRPHFVAMVTSDLVAKGWRANEIVKRVASRVGGGGGGRAELGQGSGKDSTGIDEALKPSWVADKPA